MKKILIVALLAGVAAIQSSKALTIDFDSPTPGVGYNAAYVHTGSVGGQYATPFGDATAYFAVRADPPESPAAITFGGVYNNFSMLWGSVDQYNTLQFYLGGLLVNTVLGGSLPPANGDQGPDGTRLYSTGGFSFDEIRLVTSQNAFEIDNINVSARTSVPDGGTTAALLGLAMVGVVAVRSKLSIA